MIISITGSSGFIGKEISSYLIKKKYKINKIISKKNNSNTENFKLGNYFEEKNLDKILHVTDVLIHCMGASVDNKKNKNYLNNINYLVTKKLAEKSANNNVKRFIFLSSIKVFGETCLINKPYTTYSKPNPYSKYGISKFNAEKALVEISNTSNLEVIIIRCPLVYGDKLSGNLLTLSKIIKLNIPLPLDGINNKRSFLAIDNLINFIELSLNYKKNSIKKNEIFSLSDNEIISTTQLIQKLSYSLNKKIRLFSLPKLIFKILFYLLNKDNLYDSIFKNLYVKSSKAQNLFGWNPKISMEQQLNKNKLN